MSEHDKLQSGIVANGTVNAYTERQKPPAKGKKKVRKYILISQQRSGSGWVVNSCVLTRRAQPSLTDGVSSFLPPRLAQHPTLDMRGEFFGRKMPLNARYLVGGAFKAYTSCVLDHIFNYPCANVRCVARPRALLCAPFRKNGGPRRSHTHMMHPRVRSGPRPPPRASSG